MLVRTARDPSNGESTATTEAPSVLSVEAKLPSTISHKVGTQSATSHDEGISARRTCEESQNFAVSIESMISNIGVSDDYRLIALQSVDS